MKPKDFPAVPKALLDKLEECFPVKSLEVSSLSLDQLRVIQGQREVINKLRLEFDKQNRTVLSPEKS